MVRSSLLSCRGICLAGLNRSFRFLLFFFPFARQLCALHTHPFAKAAAAAAMSSPSSGEQYEEEEDGAYESQAKRLKPSAAAEEGEIEYGAEEGESRREKAAPRTGGFSGGVRKAGAAHRLFCSRRPRAGQGNRGSCPATGLLGCRLGVSPPQLGGERGDVGVR